MAKPRRPAPFEDTLDRVTLATLSDGEAERDFQSFLEEACHRMDTDPEAYDAKSGKVRFKFTLAVDLEFDAEKMLILLSHQPKVAMPRRRGRTTAARLKEDGLYVPRVELPQPLQAIPGGKGDD